MTRRTALAALAEQTAMADLLEARLAEVTAERDAALADAAGWRETARVQLKRNAELAARPPIEVIVQGRDVLDSLTERVDLALYELEMEAPT